MFELLPKDACRVLDAARTVQVAVEAVSGPHVTPQAYLWSGDSMWLVTARTSLKARVLRRRPQVGLLVRDGGESVILSGTAQVLWPSDVGSAVQAGLALPFVPLAGAAYAARNAPLLAGYVSEVLGRRAPIPSDRVLIRVRINRGAVIRSDATDASVDRWGDWPVTTPAASPLTIAVDSVPDGVPREILAVADGAGEATMTWATTGGPLPLPATWDGRAWTATIGTGPLSLLDSTAGAPACLTVDRSTGARMYNFAGLLLRGSLNETTLEVDRATWWHGFVTGTVPVGVPA